MSSGQKTRNMPHKSGIALAKSDIAGMFIEQGEREYMCALHEFVRPCEYTPPPIPRFGEGDMLRPLLFCSLGMEGEGESTGELEIWVSSSLGLLCTRLFSEGVVLPDGPLYF